MKVNRLAYLDSIRGLAALLVVFHHILEMYLNSNVVDLSWLERLYASIDIGRVGVVVFFMVSGFVIPWSLKSGTPHALKLFAVKRFFRLYPAYWFSIFLAILIGVGPGLQVISFEQVLMNFTMIHKFLGVESVLAPYWRLHLELLFYFSCAFLFFLGILHNYKYLVLVVVLFCLMGLVAAAVLFYYEIKVPIVLPFSIAVMFYGALLRSYFLGGNTELRNVLILLALFYFICLLVTQKVYFQNGWLKWFITDVIAFCLFFLLITKMKLHNIIAVYLGRISYSLYLLHSLAIGIIFHFFNDIAFTGIGFLLVIICTITASILMAEFSYRFIEKPGLILANKYIVKYRRKEAYV